MYDHLSVRTAAPDSADLAIGFGHFDLRIAGTCGRLWSDGRVGRVAFTGGIGAGSGSLAEAEADAFARRLRAGFPDLPSDAVLVEPESTNTGENVAFLLDRLGSAGWRMDSVVLVATPYRQRRVGATWSMHRQEGIVHHHPPPSSLSEDVRLFREQGEDLIGLLPAEVERLSTYAERGWIVPEPLPPRVAAAAERLASRTAGS